MKPRAIVFAATAHIVAVLTSGWVAPRLAYAVQARDGGGGQSPNWLKSLLPSALFEVTFMELELWQWLGLIVLVAVSSIVAYIASSLIIRTLRSLVRRTETEWDDVLLRDIAGPLRLAITLFIFYAGAQVLGLSPEAEAAVNVLCKILAILAVTWLVLRLIDTLTTIAEHKFRSKDEAAVRTLAPMGKRLTKVFVGIIAFLSMLQNLGFNIAGLVAGLGVGGLAIALAAQKTVENLFGGVVVIADRPAKVGDFCKVGEHIGNVEHIGMRSTRIRTLDRTLVTIPNAEFSTVRIENYAERDRMRLHSILGMGYDTSPDQMRYLLVEIRKMLYAHPRTLDHPCRIRFVNFNAYSLDLEVFVYINTQEWNDFLAVREDIFLRIMDIVESSGTYFAYPSQTLYLGKDAGRNPELTKSAEETVRAWRERGEIPLPDFPEKMISELDDSLPYPAPGSIGAGKSV